MKNTYNDVRSNKNRKCDLVKLGSFIFKLLFRVAVGIFSILVINGIMAVSGISLALGINIYSVGMLALLGLPSLVICYGLLVI